MGGKRNKSKKFLRQRHNKRAKNNHKKKKKTEHEHKNINAASPNKQEKQTKKARELFNAGINALNEQPQIDVGLQYTNIQAPPLHKLNIHLPYLILCQARLHLIFYKHT